MKRRTDRVPSSCWEQLRTGKWQRLSLALLVAVMTMTAQTAWAASGDTYVVDANGGGDYETISAAVSAATGGETIFIKNGEYNEGFPIALEKSLSFVGESQDGVKITGPANSLFSATVTAVTLSFTKLTILNAGSGSNPAFNFRSSAHNVTITNCTFDNCGSRYGTMQLSGTATIDGCTFSKSIETQSNGAGVIYISGAGTYTIKNTIIDDVQYTYGNGYMNGAINVYNASATLNIENTTITNVNAPSNGVICTRGIVNMTGCKIQGNTIGSASNSCIINVQSSGSATIEQTIITGNTCENELFINSSSNAQLTVNYCNIHDNTASGIVNNQGTIDLESNYWGSNTLPAGITATTWVVEDNGEYKLNTGEPLAMDIPGLIPEEEPFVLPEGTIYVSESGNDENDGLSEGTAIATLAHAVEMAKSKENKTATVYMLNGDYTTDAIDIGDDEGVSLSIIGQEKGEVTIHGTGAYIFDVYGDDLVWNFKNLVFDGISSTARTSAALVLYSENKTGTSSSPKGNFTIDNCIFRNINSKLGAIAIGNDNGNTNITNCIIENVTGSASSTAILTVNGDGTYTLDNVEIKDCKLDENVASSTTSSCLRSIIYVNTYEADVTISNSKIYNNNGPTMSLIESRSKLTIENTTISDNVVDTSVSGTYGGEYLIWASNDNSDINISQCTITGNTIAKSGKGLFYNQKGSMNVEYSDISGNTVDAFIGSTGNITANNNWWGTNDQPDTKVDKWVIMNVVITDDSHLGVDKEVTIAIDFNHVKTSSGNIEELTDGEIPKESYTVEATAQNGEITPSSVVVNNGEVENQTFEVTNITDVITFACDGAQAEITLEGVEPYRGIIYVRKDGDDNNEGSVNAPVATVGKAIELALVDGGSGEIIINAGTYVGNGYHVTGDLTVTGNVTGNDVVTLDANNEGRLFYMDYGDTANKIELKNLILTNAIGYGAAVNSFADELILENDTIKENNANAYLIRSYGNLTIKNSGITKSMSGNVIQQEGNGDILIKNTVFEKNSVVDATSVMAVVNINNGSGKMVVEDSKFIENEARQGVIKGNYNYDIEVTGTEFTDNTNTVAYGGAIYSNGDNLDITDCVFKNNKAYRSGGAIYVGYRVTAKVDSCIFINNTANTKKDEYYGDAIYNGNKLTVTNSAFLGDANNYMIYNDGEDNEVKAQNCWWGTNEDPSSLNGYGYYEDDEWDEYDCPQVDVSNWATMNATTPVYGQAGDEVTVTATFSNANLPDGIPVTFASTSGNLKTEVSTVDAKASTTYTIDANDEAITATSGNATIEMPILTSMVLAAKAVTVDGQTDYWTTFYCGSAGFSFDEGENACAYTATVSGETITLCKLGQVIPKNTAVIIVSEDESIGMTISSATVVDMPQNDLHGVDVAMARTSVLSTYSADAILVLSNKGGNFGFHELATTNVPARKAFLAIDDPDLSRQFTMVFDDATGIQSIDHSPLTIDHYDGAWYSLDGRKLNGKPTAKGVYVNSGRKVVIK